MPSLPSSSQSDTAVVERPVRESSWITRGSTPNRYDFAILPELAEILDSFYNIARYYSSGARTTERRQRISQMIYNVEYQLISLSHIQEAPKTSNSTTDLSSAIRHAAHIYGLLVLRQIHWKSSIVQKYAQALSNEIDLYQRAWIKLLPDSWQHLLLWIQSLLCLVSSRTGYRDKQVAMLMATASSM